MGYTEATMMIKWALKNSDILNDSIFFADVMLCLSTHLFKSSILTRHLTNTMLSHIFTKTVDFDISVAQRGF